MTPIEVSPPGANVMIGDKTPGRVSRVQLTAVGVIYQVVWWRGDTRNEQWLEAFEVSNDSTVKQPVGFHRV